MQIQNQACNETLEQKRLANDKFKVFGVKFTGIQCSNQTFQAHNEMLTSL
jgi:hypothetical protein